MKNSIESENCAKEFVKSYNLVIDKFFSSPGDALRLGTFLATKDRFHSSFNQLYQELYFNNQKASFSKFNQSVSLVNTVKSFVKWNMYLARSLFCVLYTRFLYYVSAHDNDNHHEFEKVSLIKSFAFDRSFQGEGFKDDFFGDLSQFLNKEGIHTLTIVDPLNSIFKNIKKLRGLNSNTVPFYRYNSIFDLIRIKLRIFKAFLFPPSGEVLYEEVNLAPAMRAQFRKDLFNPILLQGLLMGYAFQRILKKYSVDKIYMTFENLNWERPLISSLREVKPDLKIIGFQHAIVAQSSLNYFTSGLEDKNSMPDVVVTNGEATKEILEEYGSFTDVEIKVGCALRQKHILNLNPSNRKVKKSLLIALEGTHETVKCANYVFKHIDNLSDWEITIRTHPILPFEDLRDLLVIDVEKYENIRISNSGIMEDLERASIVIYWGTTLSIEALALGIPVIHYSLGSYLSYDPLFKLDKLKWTVTNDNDLVEIMNDIVSMSDEEFYKLRESSLEYVSKYFYKISTENLSSFVE